MKHSIKSNCFACAHGYTCKNTKALLYRSLSSDRKKDIGLYFGFIDNEDDLYNDVIYKIYDYFHLMNDIKIIETDDDGNEYYVNKYVRKGKLVYYPCYRPPVKGGSRMLGFSSFKFKYENEEDAIDHIEKHIEEKRRKKEWDRIFEKIHRELEETYIEETSPALDDSWKVVKIEGDEITYKKGRESITLKRSKPE